jgi:hypothetical protein
VQAGDNASWASPAYSDADWIPAQGGKDWREYGQAFEAINATGWYRQHLVVSSALQNTSANVTLSLGIIAGASVQCSFLDRNFALPGYWDHDVAKVEARHIRGLRYQTVRVFTFLPVST